MDLAALDSDVFGPDLVVIGAMRAGTTALHNWLAASPSVSVPKMKETDFFIEGKNWERGFDWYRGLFDQSADVTCEVSPNYSKRDVFKGVAARLGAANPDAKIVYVIRDPIERAISQVRHTWFSRRIDDLDALIDTAEEAHILASSRYAWQLEPWLEHFPQGSILLVEFQELVSNPLRVLRAIARHAGFPPPSAIPVDVNDNSSDGLRRMPSWWMSLRETSVGARLRTAAPSGMVRRVRNAVSQSQNRNPPEISPRLRHRFRAQLEEDANRLRALAHRDYAHWSV